MRTYLAIFILSSWGLSSCITILQPLINSSNIVTDDRILGKWSDSDTRMYMVKRIRDTEWRLSQEDIRKHKYTYEDSVIAARAYLISFQQNNLDYSWLGGLIKIDQNYFMQFAPMDCLDSLGKDAYSLEKSFTSSVIARIEWSGSNSVNLRFFNGGKIRDIILNGHARINYEYDPLFDTMVISASSGELKKFIEKYGDYESLYTGGNLIRAVRKK